VVNEANLIVGAHDDGWFRYDTALGGRYAGRDMPVVITG
jgi:hypothetical protein